SSRRRHTRSKRDWSSDVCSSDLKGTGSGGGSSSQGPRPQLGGRVVTIAAAAIVIIWAASGFYTIKEAERGVVTRFGKFSHLVERSEERRVGKEWRRGRSRAW